LSRTIRRVLLATLPVQQWYPPLITIDHILTRNAAASSIRTVEVPGSGHRALLATIAVPTG
jgi:endonuclease/exonuclease/phosphatase (EEP) superfamily protein YafD